LFREIKVLNLSAKRTHLATGPCKSYKMKKTLSWFHSSIQEGWGRLGISLDNNAFLILYHADLAVESFVKNSESAAEKCDSFAVPDICSQ
jgi:hypothetical protein